jgi:hypothetical protein
MHVSYAKLVWQVLQSWIGGSLLPPPTRHYRQFKTWWNNMISVPATGGADRAQQVLYTIWNIWKERCRQVFDNKGVPAQQLQATIRLDVAQWRIAWR